MITLRQQLDNHDWTFDYSDDASMRRRGEAQKRELQMRLRSLNCPYDWEQLQMEQHEQVREYYKVDDKGRYYKQQWLTNCWGSMYHPEKSEWDKYLTLEKYAEILYWIELQG